MEPQETIIMITGPAVGPAMLLMVLMRWPSLIVVGAGSVGGKLISNEINHRYNLTEQIQTWYRTPTRIAAIVSASQIENFQLVKDSPTVVSITTTQIEPQQAVEKRLTPTISRTEAAQVEQPQAMEQRLIQSHSVQAIFALSLEKELKPAVKKANVNYSQKYIVQKGDTLMKIINRLRVPVQLQNDVMSSLLLENQRAFQDFDPDKLIEGSVLSIPQLANNEK